jgi:hypothetical protein
MDRVACRELTRLRYQMTAGIITGTTEGLMSNARARLACKRTIDPAHPLKKPIHRKDENAYTQLDRPSSGRSPFDPPYSIRTLLKPALALATQRSNGCEFYLRRVNADSQGAWCAVDPKRARGGFLVEWPVYFASGRLPKSSRKSAFGERGH